MHTKAERKHNTWNKILRKLNVIKDKDLDREKFVDQPHRLSKDKAVTGKEKKKVSKKDQQQLDAAKHRED